MNKYVRLHCLVEGQTEQIFAEKILAPYLAHKGVGITASLIGKRGGDIRFDRAQNDIRIFLLGDKTLYVTFLIDFYGTSKVKWPGFEEASSKRTSQEKAAIVYKETAASLTSLVNDAAQRFIPYVSMHEFEALLFSAPLILAQKLTIPIEKINCIPLIQNPEEINNSPSTAPSKRLEALHPRFKKTGTGIAIAEAIGIDTMRQACPLFNQWITAIEALSLTSQE